MGRELRTLHTGPPLWMDVEHAASYSSSSVSLPGGCWPDSVIRWTALSAPVNRCWYLDNTGWHTSSWTILKAKTCML